MKKKTNNHVVWISAAGTNAAFGIAKSLRSAFGENVLIITADTNPKHLVATTTISDDFVQVPPVSDGEYIKVLIDSLERYKVDTYVPILDEEIVLATDLMQKKHIRLRNTLTTISAKTAKICFDKFRCAQYLNDNSLPTPKTELMAEAKWNSEGVIVKPRCGRGSIGFQRIEDKKEFEALKKKHNDLIVQEICNGPEITIDVFSARTKPIYFSACRERIETKAGVCTKARVFFDPVMSEIAKEVSKRLSIKGTFCLQVMRKKTGEWAVTDINPRVGGGTAMAVAAGADVITASFADLWGLNPMRWLKKVDSECYVVRSYMEHVFR